MRIPNFKVGWLLEKQVAALTHFHSDITDEDIQGVTQKTVCLLQEMETPFHILIDNRLVHLHKIYSLVELQNSSPIFLHPCLSYVVMVKPNHLSLSNDKMLTEQCNNVHLKNVPGILEAFEFLNQIIPDFYKIVIQSNFFP